MNYLDRVADAIKKQVPVELIPDDDVRLLFHIYALLALAKGEATSAKDVHDAWVLWKLQTDQGHPALRQFAELSPFVQAMDAPYVAAIREVAHSLQLREGN